MPDAKPDAKDAAEVVTDPANLAGAGDTHSGLRAVNEHKAVAALRALGASRADARNLAVEAIGELGGRVETRVEPGGLRSGRPTPRVVEAWYVPAEKVRGDGASPDAGK